MTAAGKFRDRRMDWRNAGDGNVLLMVGIRSLFFTTESKDSILHRPYLSKA